eukprot:TRINITY_DN5954_c0_g2_i1.p1 TRINITY_DN5954_c0_g2~~TRINITY_DN5954_c0_g2_i1.p1  ORF type:complete len:460 (-),score=51.65 TRINITY_DN5954_c0_g2_i1:246-1625(-)
MASGFIDHYAAFGSDIGPETSHDELRKLYFEQLRQYHPDKRPTSAGEIGPRVTQALNLAYETLGDPARRETYDALWRQEKEASLPPYEKANIFRRRGNELYSKARELVKSTDQFVNLRGVQESVKLYQAAMAEYGKALECMPNDHRLYSNRALCYIAVDDWVRCKEDAQHCTQLRPDFMKGWFLLVKALWSLGLQNEAFQELHNGLHAIPGCRDLLELQSNLASGHYNERPPSGHSVSPACTPPRSNTPTKLHGQTTPPLPHVRRPMGSSSPGPGQRPVSPPLVAAGSVSAGGRSGRSPGPPGWSQTFGGIPPTAGSKPSSRSPGASGRSHPPPPPPPPRSGPCLDGSFGTGNFGAPTPSFAAGGPPSMEASFPASATEGGGGNSFGPGASSRGTYSPGPSARGARGNSSSPGPSIHMGGASFGTSTLPTGSAGSRGASPSLRKSPSLRSLSESGKRKD